jgi:hypothetical protein
VEEAAEAELGLEVGEALQQLVHVEAEPEVAVVALS